jgi:carboxypeptidase Taq
VGTAYGAQIMAAMRKSVGVDAAIKNGSLAPVVDWLRENVHRHGESLSPEELLRLATGEPFNPDYYADYLYDKFTGLYA